MDVGLPKQTALFHYRFYGTGQLEVRHIGSTSGLQELCMLNGFIVHTVLLQICARKHQKY